MPKKEVITLKYWVVWKAPKNDHKRCPEGWLDDGKWHCFGEYDPGRMAWILLYFRIPFYIFEPTFTRQQVLAEAKRQHVLEINASSLPAPKKTYGETGRLF